MAQRPISVKRLVAGASRTTGNHGTKANLGRRLVARASRTTGNRAQRPIWAKGWSREHCGPPVMARRPILGNGWSRERHGPQVMARRPILVKVWLSDESDTIQAGLCPWHKADFSKGMVTVKASYWVTSEVVIWLIMGHISMACPCP